MTGPKNNCTCIPKQHPKFRLRGVQPDWEEHPSWIAGIEALDAYNNWVSEPEVYASVPLELKDDIGVVVAAAFELVKTLPGYQAGLKESEAYEAALANGTWNAAKTNPIWSGIVKEVRTNTQATFDAQAWILKDTIR
jgi:hypothetical protein